MEKKIKIIFILPTLAWGGAQRVVINILRKLDKSLFDLELIVFNSKINFFEDIPINIKFISLKKKKFRYAFYSLLKYLLNKKPDIIFSTSGYINLFIISLRFLFQRKTKIVIREANSVNAITKSMKFTHFFRFLYRKLYKKADKVIALSSVMVTELNKLYCVPQKKIKIIYNPIDEVYIKRNIRKIRRPFSENINLIASGRLVWQKGFDRLIKAFSYTNENLNLIIMGDGPEELNLKKIVREKNLDSKISFIGFQRNPWEWYASADAMIIASRWEGMPNNALEALACGCPIIADIRAGGVTDLKQFDNQKAIRLVSTIEDLIIEMNNTLKRNMADFPSQSLLPDRFKIDYSIKNYEELFKSIYGMKN